MAARPLSIATTGPFLAALGRRNREGLEFLAAVREADPAFGGNDAAMGLLQRGRRRRKNFD
jgi:hypothetical protein